MDADDLTDAERETFRRLPRERQPPAALEDAIVASLKARGHLADHVSGQRRTRWLMPAFAGGAAIVIAFGIGVRVGARLAAPPPPAPRGGAAFVLLMYEGAAFQNPAPGREEDRATEYRGWANGLGRDRAVRVLGGNELAATSAVLPDGAAAGGGERDVRGYFIITAANADAAAAVARTCPHLKYGGTIAVKPIIEH